MRGVADGDDLEGADNGDVLEVVAGRELLEVTAGKFYTMCSIPERFSTK